MKFFRYFLASGVTLSLLSLGQFAFAEEVLHAVSDRASAGTLSFSEKPTSRKASESVFCTAAPTAVKEAQLYMPDMGHGSSPTRLEPIAGSECTKILEMDFFMDGAWEVRVQLQSGEKFVFPVQI